MTQANNQDLTEILRTYGLTDNEAAIYLFLLKNDDQTAFYIAQGTRIPRTTVYATVEKLKEMGIITTFRKNNVVYFTAENPKRLINILKEKEEMMLGAIPSLLDLTRQKGLDPKIRFYTGKESIKAVFTSLYEDLQARGIKQLHTVSHPELQEFFPKYLPEILHWKKKLKIHTSLIVPAEFESQLPESYQSDEYRTTRFLPNKFPFRGTLMIAADKIAIFSFDNNKVYAVTIESTIITNMLRQFFLFTWEMIGPKE